MPRAVRAASLAVTATRTADTTATPRAEPTWRDAVRTALALPSAQAATGEAEGAGGLGDEAEPGEQRIEAPVGWSVSILT